MEPEQVLEDLRAILTTRLKFDPRRAADVTLDTPLPKGIEGAIGLDSLDFIELSIAVEERFGIVMEDAQDLTAHFMSFGTLCRFIVSRIEGA